MKSQHKTVLKIVAATVFLALLMPSPYFILLQRMGVIVFSNLPFYLENPKADVIIFASCFTDWIIWLGFAGAYTVLLVALQLKFVWKELKKIEAE
jgi:hypothetical protein